MNNNNNGEQDNKKYLFGKMGKRKFFISCLIILFIGVLAIISTYAWISTSLDVRIKNFNMIVSRNSGLSISFDAINYDTSIEITKDVLYNNLSKTYPSNLTQWPSLGLYPVSSLGIPDPNTEYLELYVTDGVNYYDQAQTRGYVSTYRAYEPKRSDLNYFLAFDLFFKNDSGSPANDNLYLAENTHVTIEEGASEEMQGIVNSIRIAFVKIGDVPLDATPQQAQAIKCDNKCFSVIYEPNSSYHSPLSCERAKKFDVDIEDGKKYDTFASSKPVSFINLENVVSGSPLLNTEYFTKQNTITEADFGKPIFQLINGVTKVRVYVWVEGQDIDSLETNSEGADINISLDFVKDTAGYDVYN